jgi:hypothetical protein
MRAASGAGDGVESTVVTIVAEQSHRGAGFTLRIAEQIG